MEENTMKLRAIEGVFNGPDEMDIGFHMYYGSDENGDFHAMTLGLLFFSITFYRYE